MIWRLLGWNSPQSGVDPQSLRLIPLTWIHYLTSVSSRCADGVASGRSTLSQRLMAVCFFLGLSLSKNVSGSMTMTWFNVSSSLWNTKAPRSSLGSMPTEGLRYAPKRTEVCPKRDCGIPQKGPRYAPKGTEVCPKKGLRYAPKGTEMWFINIDLCV